MLVPKNIKYEKVLGYQLYPYIELDNNTFFVIQDQLTWQDYFMPKDYDLRSPKVVDLNFEEDMLIVIFKKTHEIWKFDTEKVTNQNGNLYVSYTAKIIGVNAYKISDFLHIIKVKKDDFKNIRFFENDIPITDIPIDEQPQDVVEAPIVFIPDFEEDSQETDNPLIDERVLEVDDEDEITEKSEEMKEESGKMTLEEETDNPLIDERVLEVDDEDELTEKSEEMKEVSDKMTLEEEADNPLIDERTLENEDKLTEKKVMDSSIENVKTEEKKVEQKVAKNSEKAIPKSNSKSIEKENIQQLKKIPELSLEEKTKVAEKKEDELISPKKEIQVASKKAIEETPGINNTQPSIKDKLAQIEQKNEAMAEEQMEDIGEESSAYKTRRMTKIDATTDAAMNNVTESNQQFGFNVFEQVMETELGNIVFSPFALSTALAMTYAGARNTTESQMLKTLQFHDVSNNLHRNYEKLLEELALDGSSLSIENTGTELMVGNAIWIDEKLEMSDPYSDIAKKNYRGSLRNVNFKDKELVLEEINNWMKVKTAYNMIDELPASFKPDESSILLTNNLYLKTKWNLPFDKSYTQATTFKVAEDNILQVNMMHIEGKFPYFENSMVQTVAIPCNDDFTMLVMIPNAYFQLKAVQKTLMRGGYTHWLNSMEEKTVQLSIPRFSFDTQMDMVDVLEKVGMTYPFDKKSVDFSGMFIKRNAPIGNVLQPTHIHINESGISTEENSNTDGAGTWNGTESDTDEDVYIFEANRPFMFIIIDNQRRNLLLMGRVMQPELSE
ncbi:MAG: serpin family protein [Chitinophagales bacterium]